MVATIWLRFVMSADCHFRLNVDGILNIFGMAFGLLAEPTRLFCFHNGSASAHTDNRGDITKTGTKDGITTRLKTK
jgi:hypothetical protein